MLKNNTYDRILCLTATLEDEKLEITKKYAPIIWETPRQRAIDLKLVSESLVFNLTVELTDEERAKYTFINNNYIHYEDLLGGPQRAYSTSGRFMRLNKMDKTGSNVLVYIPQNRVIYTHEVDEFIMLKANCRSLTTEELTTIKEKIHCANMYWKYMRERRMIVISAENKIAITKQICDRYSDRKGIIFSESTIFADKIAKAIGDNCAVYHSKMKPVDKALALAQFSDNTKQHISSVKALTAGTDVPECSLGIGTSGDSKKLGHTQRNGRTSRFIEGKVSYFINLYCKDTQEINWIRNGTKSMEPKWIESIDELPLN